MTRDEYIAASAASDSPLPIMLADGRMGLCCHHTDTEILVDAYTGNECEQIAVAFEAVRDIGGGCLVGLS
jgi:hypothetical protein